MTATYRITITSRNLYFIAILLSVSIGLVLSCFLLLLMPNKVSTIIYYIIGIILVFVCFHFIQRISKKTGEITFKGDHVIFNLPFYHWKKARVFEVLWVEIKEFLVEPNQNFMLVKFTLINGKKIKFLHDSNDSKTDQFKSFELGLRKKIALLNRGNPANGILESPTIYERPLGKVIAIFLAIALAVIPIIYYVRGIHRLPPYLLTLYSGGFFFIWMVYKSRK